MTITWIMVANASHAKLFANKGPNKGLELVKELDHPESRERAAELVSDRIGNFAGSGSYAQPTAPKEHEAERFAQEIAQELEQGRVSNSYEKLVMVTSSHFMGLINGRISQQVKSKISDAINKDYTHLPVKELTGHLANHVYL
ncbi:host attachment protein [Parasulfuritortus cantonensis]|uniref:Host attachment protein n=1 Tax=Parasulfuritortus cantonensis TaxID=2528202 RepID=A0A4R1BDI1_9PROT|nr:host attachment protein [Parasulfuritortus cantonensis]TCJ15166.1 host attachment protein [Parasulfuritortus cantonensis]